MELAHRRGYEGGRWEVHEILRIIRDQPCGKSLRWPQDGVRFLLRTAVAVSADNRIVIPRGDADASAVRTAETRDRTTVVRFSVRLN